MFLGFNIPRSGQMLNVVSEKVDQRTVQEAMCAAVDQWPDVQIQDYAVAESTLLAELGEEETQNVLYSNAFSANISL